MLEINRDILQVSDIIFTLFTRIYYYITACQAGRWGVPREELDKRECQSICDKCYNGGVCDDKSGKCICPPGFMGENCLTGRYQPGVNSRIKVLFLMRDGLYGLI